MNFYETWEATRKNKVEDFEFFKEFFNKTEKTLVPLQTLKLEDTVNIIKFLLSIPMDDFIKNILKMEIEEFTAENIVQFSNFNHAYKELLSILLFENKALGYNDLGSKLMHSKSEVACKKYGENHSKLASEMSYVTLKRNGIMLVELTTLGSVVASINDEDKFLLSVRMLTRNILVRNIINLSEKDFVSYEDLTKSILSTSTMSRRKSNVKKVVELILDSSNYTDLKKNIIW